MFKHILIPTDGSKLSCQAMKQAIFFAADAHAEVTLLTVVEPFHILAVDAEDFLAQRDHYERVAATKCKSMLSRWKSEAERYGVSCDTLVVQADSVSQAIIKAAIDTGCDLIAMSSHGRGSLGSLIVGGVTNKVLALSNTPVLIYR